MYDEVSGRKRVSVARLCELIESLPKHAFLEVNQVGNLAITNASMDYVGVVDFNEELVTWWIDPCKISKP